MTLCDTHCHLDLEQFDSDRDAVIERAAQAGVNHILIPALNLVSSRSVLNLANCHLLLYAAVGVHPTEAATWTESTKSELHLLTRTLLSPLRGRAGESTPKGDESKLVAIGEIGLDYYWDSAPHELQKKVLQEQLDLAADVGLPVILHMRESKESPGQACASDLLMILGKWVAALKSKNDPLAKRPGVLHSFSGTLETAREAVDLGFYIGVTGPVTFTNAHPRHEILAALPLSRLLIETDAPFQTPQPYRGKRNEPAYVRLIADKIGYLHSRPIEAVAAATSENASRLFNWK